MHNLHVLTTHFVTVYFQQILNKEMLKMWNLTDGYSHSYITFHSSLCRTRFGSFESPLKYRLFILQEKSLHNLKSQHLATSELFNVQHSFIQQPQIIIYIKLTIFDVGLS